MKDKILVVDDMEMNREILRGIFEDDYEVILAENGREAVEYINLNRGKLAAILLDIVMPGIDGFDICRKIRSWESETLVVFISANEELVFQSFEVQPFHFLRKNHIDREIGLVAQEILRKLRQKKTDKVVIREERSGKLHILPVKDTLYVEAQLRTCIARLKKEEITIRRPFRELESQLLASGFIKVHRSYLVNYRHIYRIENQKVILNDGIEIPISRDRIGDVKKEFMIWNRR